MLTEGVDSGKDFVGTAKDDLFSSNTKLVVNPATGTKNTIDTIDSEDILDGGKGTDTLSIVTASGTAASPTLTNIENVNVKFQVANTIDLENATGVETVKVHNSTAAATGTVLNVAGATLSVANQIADVDFDGSTAEKLNLNFDTVGTAAITTTATPAALITVDLGLAAGTAKKATSFNITAKDAYVDLNESAASGTTTSATIAATGTNEIKFTDDATTLTSVSVTGKGSVDLSGAALIALKTLTAADGGVTVNANGTVLETVTTGAGADTITVLTAGLSETSVVNLGAGDDSLTLNFAPTAGAKIDGGAGTDTLATTYTIYNSVSGFTATNLAKITGFETLNITGGVLASGDNVDLSKLAGLTSAQISGVTTAVRASITNVGANSTVTVKGDMRAAPAGDDGALTVSLKDASGTNDVVNIVLDQEITQNIDAIVDTYTSAIADLTLTGIETVNVTSTGTLSAAVTTGSATDVAVNDLTIINADMKTLTISGDQAATFNTAAAHVALTTIDASANTAGVTIDANLSNTLGISIKGSLTAANTLTGTKFADTIIGGSAADTITGGIGGDTLTGNGGNDIFDYNFATESTIVAGQTDTITDFIANTVGNATNTGAILTGAGAVDATKLNGDVIDLTAFKAILTAGIKVGVYANASDATTFISNSNTSDGATAFGYAALDSSTNKLYIDVTSDGISDMYINLTGVTTIDAAAFALV